MLTIVPSVERANYIAVRRFLYYAIPCTIVALLVFAVLFAVVGLLTGHEVGAVPLAGLGAVATQRQPMPAIPFTGASHEHVEPAFTLTVTPGAAVQQLNPIDIPASGYLRSILLEVTFASGTVGVLNADGPANLFQSILLQDVNGTNIYGPLDGYTAAITNIVGGHAFKTHEQVGAADPATVIVGPNPVFSLRVPVEISHHDALGAVANQNSGANLKLTLAINSEAALTTTPWTVDPTVTIKGWLETWTLPAQVDARNNPQMQVPPLLGTGMYWSSRSKAVGVGDNTVEFTRLGNLLRAVMFIARDVSGVRSNACFPDPMSFNWDGNAIWSRVSQRYMRTKFNESIYNTANVGALPAGVFVLPFNTGGPGGSRMGDEDPDLWLPTTQTSRIEINGTVATAGTVQVATCEVAPYEVNQAERYEVPNRSGALAMPSMPTTQGS